MTKTIWLKIYIFSLLILLLFFGIKNAPDFIPASARAAVSLSSAITYNIHGKTGLIYSRSITSYFRNNPEYIGKAKVISDKMLQDSLSIPTDYDKGDLSILTSDDLGEPILYIIATKLFGLKINSLAKFIAIIIAVLVACFLLRYRNGLLSNVLVLSWVISLSFYASAGFDKENTYGAHGIPYISLLLMLYWMYSFYYSLDNKRSFIDWSLDIIIGLFFSFFLICRATVKIQLVGIILVAGVLLWIYREKLFTSKNLLINFCAPIPILLVLIVVGRSAVNTSLHPSYSGSRRRHPFWHNIYIAFGAYPNKYHIGPADENGFKRATTSKYNVWGEKLKIYSQDYEDILKQETIDLIKKDPLFVMETVLKKMYLMLYMFYERLVLFIDNLFLFSFIGSCIMLFFTQVKPFSKDEIIFSRILFPAGILLLIEPILAHPIFNKEVWAYFVIYLIFIALTISCSEWFHNKLKTLTA